MPVFFITESMLRNRNILRFGFLIVLIPLNILWITLFAYQRFGENAHLSETQTLEVQQHLLALKSVDIQLGNDTSLHLEKTGSEWRITDPVDWEAHPLVMGRFLQTLLSLKSDFILKTDPETDLSPYGLEQPLCTLTLTTDEAQTCRCVIGKPTDDTQKTYLLLPEKGEIFSIGNELSEFLESPAEHWAFPYIGDFKTLKTIALEAPQQKMLLEQSGQTWSLKLPVPVPVNTQKAHAISQQLRHLQIERFLTHEEVQTYREIFPDENSTFRLILSDGETTEILNLLPKKIDPSTYIGQRNDEESLFIVKTDIVETLLHASETLSKRTVFDLDFSKIRQITCRRQGEQIVLRPLDTNEWERSIRTENNIPVQTQKIPASRCQSFIETLNDTWQAEAFLESEPDIRNKTRADLEIATLDGTLSAILYYNQNTACVKLSNEPMWIQLTTFDSDGFRASFEASENKTVWKFNTDERVTRLQLKSPHNETMEQLPPEDYKEMALSHLEADRWLETEPAPTFPTDTYTLLITTENGEHAVRTYELTFSERIGGTLQTGSYLGKKFIFTPEWVDFLFRITEQKQHNDALRAFLKP